MQTNSIPNVAVLEVPNPVSAPQQTPARQENAPKAAWVATAVFAAGFVSYWIGDSSVARTSPETLPAAPSQSLPTADPTVLVPFDGGTTLTPQYEDGLVSFAPLAPLSSEGPLPSVLPMLLEKPAIAEAAPVGVGVRRLASPAAHTGPMVEITGGARGWFQPVVRAAGGFRILDLTGKARLAAQTAARMAALLGTQMNIAWANDPARQAYNNAVQANGGYHYEGGESNDFAHGYDQVCHTGGYRCTTNLDGATIRTPEGAVIKHRYDHASRNHITVTMPDGKSANLSHCPLVFDLGGNGVRTSDRPIRYDIDGKGRLSLIHDIASNTGVLVFDSNRNGVAGENGREAFGDGTDLDGNGLADGYLDGFDALKAFVLKAEKEGVLLKGATENGLLNALDLAALHRRYGLGLRKGSLGAKTVSPFEAGVKEIQLSLARSVRAGNFDGQGNDVVRREGAVFARNDGTTGSYEDVFFSYRKTSLNQVAFAR